MKNNLINILFTAILFILLFLGLTSDNESFYTILFVIVATFQLILYVRYRKTK